MKCYACGQADKHLVNCPLNLERFPGKTKQSLKPAHDDETFDKLIDGEQYVHVPKRQFASMLPRPETIKNRLAFLPLSSGNNTIPAWGCGNISTQPQRICQPYRLWIDESIAPCFTISGIYLGVDSSSFVDCGNIPAMMFRTGRWPLPPEPDKHTEFGIDLSSWKTIHVGQRVTLAVNNISAGCMPFRGAMEVWTLD